MISSEWIQAYTEMVARQTAYETVKAFAQKDDEDADMKRLKIKLEDGSTMWISGKTISEAFLNGWNRLSSKLPAKMEETCQKENMTFKTYAEEWFELYKKPKVGTAWANCIAGLLRNHLYPAFGDMKLTDITAQDIAFFYADHAEGSMSVAKKLKDILTDILRSACEDGLLERNPADSRRLIVKGTVQKRTEIGEDDMNELLGNLHTLNREDLRYVVLLLYTGMRRGELLALRWEDIDFDLNEIHVQRAVSFIGNTPTIKGPKSKAGNRTVPLLPELKEALMKDRMESGYVFGQDKVYSRCRYARMWERIQKKLNIPDVTAHQFRHTFATRAKNYLDAKTLQEILGHASITTTMDIYAHTTSEDIQNATQKMSGIYKKDKKSNTQK